jgi:hypothetical protein
VQVGTPWGFLASPWQVRQSVSGLSFIHAGAGPVACAGDAPGATSCGPRKSAPSAQVSAAAPRLVPLSSMAARLWQVAQDTPASAAAVVVSRGERGLWQLAHSRAIWGPSFSMRSARIPP